VVWLATVVTFLLGLLVGQYLPGYFREKGKNLATKEDIAGITRKIEAVRSSYGSEIERLRADLRVQAHERETRFARFHDRRLEAIEGLHHRLVAVRAAFYSFITTKHEDVGWPEVVRGASEAAKDVTLFFAQHKIFFDPDIRDQFAEIDGALKDAWETFAMDLPHQAEGEMTRDEGDRRRKAWKQAKDKDIVSETLPSLIGQIEESMRAILSGDEYAVSDSSPHAESTKLVEKPEE